MAVNAFDLMRKAQKSGPPTKKAAPGSPKKDKAAGDKDGDKEASTSEAPAPKKVAPVFKGSGLGKGPSHSYNEREQPWVEKYRPKNLDEVAAQEHTVNVLKKALTSANLPHMLFYGPPGTGKTSTILALCKQLFGPELYKSRVLELNASDERGISVVREKIKTFAKVAVSRNDDPNYPAPPFKIIILDEADSMTQDAQSALRRVMENYSRITRFCLVCNYVTRIIEPITSRCSKFRFKPLDQSNTLVRLKDIATKESVEYEDGALETLIGCSDGDLRRAITYLQTAQRLHSVTSTPVSSISIQEIAGVVPDAVMHDLARSLGVEIEGSDGMDVDDDKGFEGVTRNIQKITREGFSAVQILTQLHDLVILNPLVSSRAKAAVAQLLGEADKCLTDGADEELQLWSLCTKARRAVKAAA